MITSGLETNKIHFKTHFFVYKQSQIGPFYYIVLHCIGFYKVNLTISPLDRPIIAGLKGFP